MSMQGMTWGVYFEQIQMELEQFVNTYSSDIEKRAVKKAMLLLNEAVTEVTETIGYEPTVKLLEFKLKTVREQVELYRLIGAAKFSDVQNTSEIIQ